MERLRPALRRLLFNQRIPPWDGEDLVQEALAAGLRRWSTIENKEAWLYGTVRRMSRVYWRERRGSPVVPLEASSSYLRRTVAARQDRRDMELDLRRRCAELPSRQGRLVYLRYALGMSMRQAASAMGISCSTVFRQERRALKRLRRLLASGEPSSRARLNTCSREMRSRFS